jgi:hypothetical protein
MATPPHGDQEVDNPCACSVGLLMQLAEGGMLLFLGSSVIHHNSVRLESTGPVLAASISSAVALSICKLSRRNHAQKDIAECPAACALSQVQEIQKRNPY